MPNPDNDELRREAERRDRVHRDKPSGGWAAPDLKNGKGDYIGLLGERAVCERYGLTVDMKARPNGDGGRDGKVNTIHGVIEWDVKTCRIRTWDPATSTKPFRMLIKAYRCKPRTIYILARHIEKQDRAVLMGWRWGEELLTTEPRDYGTKGIISVGWMANDLRPMSELDAMVIR